MERRQVEVNGIRLDTTITGPGSPTVVLCDSAGGDGEQWEHVVPLLGGYTVLTYARPGLDDSDPLPAEDAAVARPARWAAEQLRELLRAAGVPGPFVVAGCSVGGLIADAFATAYPDEVAGIVQVDASPLTDIPTHRERTTIDEADGRGIVYSWPMTWADARSARPRTGLPAVVLTRDSRSIEPDIIARYWAPLTAEEVDAAWLERQREWADRLGAVHVLAEDSGHHINRDRPALVALAIHAVVHAAARSRRVEFDPQALQAAHGHPVTV